MNFYAIECEEGREFFVKKTIESLLSNSRVYAPIDSRLVNKNNKIYRIFEKKVQGYLVLEAEPLTQNDLRKIKNVEFVLNIIMKPGSKKEPETLSREEKEDFIGNYEELSNELVGCQCLVIEGTYSGYLCDVIKKINNDFFVLIKMIHDPKITLPIWYLAKEVK